MYQNGKYTYEMSDNSGKKAQISVYDTSEFNAKGKAQAFANNFPNTNGINWMTNTLILVGFEDTTNKIMITSGNSYQPNWYKIEENLTKIRESLEKANSSVTL